MNTKLISTAPTAGELAEQRHLVDPLDHVLEHLADERRPAAPHLAEDPHDSPLHHEYLLCRDLDGAL